MSIEFPFDIHEPLTLLPEVLCDIYPDCKEIFNRLKEDELEVLCQNNSTFIVLTKNTTLDSRSSNGFLIEGIPFVDPKSNKRIDDAFHPSTKIAGPNDKEHVIVNLRINKQLDEYEYLKDLASKWMLDIVVQDNEVIVTPLEESVLPTLKMTDPLVFSCLFLMITRLMNKHIIYYGPKLPKRKSIYSKEEEVKE